MIRGRIRRPALLLHRWTGLVAGLVVTIVAWSGAALLLAVRGETRAATTTWRVEAPRPGTTPVPPSRLLAVARTVPETTARPLSLQLELDPTAAALVRFRDGSTAYVDPWRGRLLGGRPAGATLSGRLAALHTRLLAGSIGRWIVLVGSALVVGLVPLGVLLWWPRRGGWRRALAIRLGRGARRASRDLHETLGAYTALLLFLLAGTGVLLAVPPLRELAVRGAARALPGRGSAPASLAAEPLPAPGPPLDAALAHGRRLFPDAVWIRAVLPGGDASVIRVLAAAAADGDATRYHTVRVSGQGAVLRVERYDEAGAVERADRLVNQLHTAAGLGPWYRWAAFAVCVVGGTLPLTGLVMWLGDRRRRRRAAVRPDRSTTPKE